MVKGGYSSLMEPVAATLNIHMGVVVSQISYDNQGVKVTAASGELNCVPMSVLLFWKQISCCTLMLDNQLVLLLLSCRHVSPEQPLCMASALANITMRPKTASILEDSFVLLQPLGNYTKTSCVCRGTTLYLGTTKEACSQCQAVIVVMLENILAVP